MPFLNDPVAEIVDTYAWQARQARIQSQAQSITPRTAQLVSDYARYMPWMKPGVNLSLSRAGIPPTDPRIEGISDLSLAQNYQTAQYGRAVPASQLDPGANPPTRGSASQRPVKSGTSEHKPFQLVADLAQGRLTAGLQQKANEEGFVGVDELRRRHPDLRAAIGAANRLIKNGYFVSPTNLSGPRGKAWEQLQAAFLQAGVDLPFVESLASRTDPGRPGIIRAQGTPGMPRGAGSIHWLDEVLYPQEPTPSSGGQGILSGAQVIPQSVAKLNRQPDPRVAQQLQAAGINYDPANPLAPLSLLAQPTGIVMNAPVQELQGQFRNVIGAAHGKPVNWLESQSDLGVVLGAAQQGKALSPGMGFFVDPESEVAMERRRREAKRGLIGDHVITVGRFFADTVTEPDTTAFNVLSGTIDAGVQLADPSAYALGKLGKVREARALFEVEGAARNVGFDIAGRVPGLRAGLHGQTVASWLDSEAGIKSIEALTEAQSPAKIWVAMGRRVDPRLAAQLADTATTTETRTILESVLGPYIRSPAEIETATANLASDANPLLASAGKLNPRISQSRLMRWMPTEQLDTQDYRQFATNLERHMINARVPVGLQEEIIDSVARAETSTDLINAYNKAMTHEQGVLVQYGISQENASIVLDNFNRTYATHNAGLVNEVGEDVPVWTKMLNNGEMTEVPGPHLILEHSNRYIPLPDARRIKRLTSDPKWRWLTTTMSPEAIGQSRFPIAAMDFLTQQIWKPFTLLGRAPAWMLRVVGESQLRMATANLDSVFRHPIDYFGYLIGKKGGISPAGLAIDELDEFRGSLTSGHGGWISRPGVIRSSKPIVVPKVEERASEFLNAWGDELAMLHADPISRYVLENGVDDAEQWLLNSAEGQKHLKVLRESHPGNMLTHDQIYEYLHGTIARRITLKTGGNTDLIGALKTGVLDEVPILVNTNRTNPKFISKLESLLDSAPDNVRGFQLDVRRAGISFPERYNRGVDWLFSHTMGAADNKWDRAPTFKQYLWQHTRQLMQYASPEAQKILLANAEKANLPSRLMKGLKRATRVSGELGAEEVDILARGYAADSSKKLLYDLAEKGQAADAMRIIAPFANAYQEIFGAWGKLLNEIGGPGAAGKLIGAARILRRSQQVIQGARGEDFGSTVGAPAGEGFFFKDEYGEEVFIIPGSEFITQALTRSHVPVPLTGRVQGLNMVGNVVPGLGPVAAIPVAWMIQDKPAFNGLHDLLLPYGAPGEREPSDITNLLSYAPSWMRRAFDAATNGGQDQRLWANAQKDAMAYLFSTGEYDTTTRQGMQKLLEDSKKAAKDLYVIRSFAQFFSPTPPAFRFLIEDKSGKLLATSVLTEDYYKLQEADYEHAGQNFMDLYGEDAFLAIIPKSGASTYGIPRNREQLNFVLNNPNLKHNFPSTYGFFLPQSDDFDYEVYLRSFTEGDREDLTPEQWLNLSNSMRGDMVYRIYKEKVGDRTDKVARDYLATVREKILEMFPSGPSGLPEKPDTEEMVRELYLAAEDDTVSSTDAGKGLALYLQYRDQAQAYAEALGRRSFNSSDDTAYLRTWLNKVADKVIERHPDFAFMWDIVFSREARLEGVEENGS